MSLLLKILAVLSAIGGVLGFLSEAGQHEVAVAYLAAGVVSAAALGGFARMIDLLENIAERTPEVPGRIESTWVPMMSDWRVGSVSVLGGGYQAMCQKKGEDPVFLEAEGTRRLFQTRVLAHQEAEAFLRARK